jgi:hypothetical protein
MGRCSVWLAVASPAPRAVVRVGLACAGRPVGWATRCDDRSRSRWEAPLDSLGEKRVLVPAFWGREPPTFWAYILGH